LALASIATKATPLYCCVMVPGGSWHKSFFLGRHGHPSATFQIKMASIDSHIFIPLRRQLLPGQLLYSTYPNEMVTATLWIRFWLLSFLLPMKPTYQLLPTVFTSDHSIGHLQRSGHTVQLQILLW
jgi:hypothetical protein